VVRHASTTKQKGIRTAVLFAFSMLVLLGIAPGARAAAVGFYSGTLYYVGSPGEVNNLTVTATADSILISDPSASLKAYFGCTVIDIHGATCPSKYVTSLYVKTGDLDDTVSLQPPIPAMLDCGEGTDVLRTPSTSVKQVNCEYVNPPYVNPPATPTTPPAVIPVVPPPLSIERHVTTMTARGDVPLVVSCSADAASPCTGTLVLELPQKVKGQVGAARRGAPNILGREKLTVNNGKKRKVNISMTGRGRKMVKRRKKLHVTAKLVIKQGEKTTTTTQSLTIKAPRK
jgi:hypothetical protein